MFISFIKTYKYIISLIIFIISLLYLFYYKYNYESFAGVAFNTASWPRRLNTFGLPLDKQREALLYCADKLNTEELASKCSSQYPNPANFYYVSCLKEIAVSQEIDAGLAAVFAFGTGCQTAYNLPENPARIFCHPDLDTIFIGTNCEEPCNTDQIRKEYLINDNGERRKMRRCILKLTNTNIQNAVDLWISDEIEATKLYGPLSIWDISNVTNMNNLFKNKITFTLDISNWDVSNVTDMSNMFNGATNFNQDISNWDVSNVINISNMFYNSKIITDIIINNKIYNKWINYLTFNKQKLNSAYLFYNTSNDCVGSYGKFNECSATCGGGTRTKTYEITTSAQHGGAPCPTSPQITEPCNTQPCPIDCEGSYGEFNECSATCGGGTRTKTYEITTSAQHGGTPCPTSPQITEPCNTQPCPIDCEGSYGEFSECSATCGGGTRTKTYEITTPAQHGGTPCPISPPINETCNTQSCPIDCIGTFSTIEKCSKECGGGKETIKYVISQERKNGGKECEYTDGYTDRVDCNIFECTNTLDTPYYKRFKPLEYNKDRSYYWRRDKLVEEGIRRNQYDLQKIHNLQTSFENETDEKKKKELQDELDLYKWRDNILETKDKNTGLSRDKRDIITDYYPKEIGQPRVWMERHSHIPDYSY